MGTESSAPPDDGLTLAEAAELVGRSRRTLERHAAAGRLVSWTETRDGRELTLVSRAEVERLYASATPGDDAPPRVDAVALQGWRDARGALEELRHVHDAEVERLVADVRDARRWGRGAAAVGLLLGLAGASWASWTTSTANAAESAALREVVAAQERLSSTLEAARDREDVLEEEAASAALRAREAEDRLRAVVGAFAARAAVRAAVGGS